MSENDLQHITPEEADVTSFRVSDELIATIADLIESGDEARLHEICDDLLPIDTAEIIIKLDSSNRQKLVDILGESIDPETYLHLDRTVLEQVTSHIQPRQLAFIVDTLDSDDALDLIENIDPDRRGEVLKSLSRKIRAAVEEGLTFPEYSAGRLMQREFVAIPLFWTVGKTVDYMRAAASSLPETFHDVFIVDARHKYVGSVALNRILCAPRSAKIESLMDEDRVVIPVTMDQEEVARQFRRSELVSAPVTDDNDRLIGMITLDDIVDVIDEEAEDDVLKLGGVVSGDLHRPALATAWSRAAWLLINLCTALFAASVISLFEDAIEKIVALAVLMPIVASMGGNAGTQAMTVAVRALATNDLSGANAWRVVGKECLVGLINGTFFAILLGIAVYFWFNSLWLGAIIACALTINFFTAGFFGALVPITLSRLGQDPAPAAGVFLTTITDVIGFFAFLGLAALLLV